MEGKLVCSTANVWCHDYDDGKIIKQEKERKEKRRKEKNE